MTHASKNSFRTGGTKLVASRGRVALVLILMLMVALCVRFAYLQLLDPNDYRMAALDQYTSSVTISAKRGTIYANDGSTELAVSATVYNCFISPYDIKQIEYDSSEPVDSSRVLEDIAEGLSSILSVDKESIITKGQRTNSKYQVIKKFLTEKEEQAVRTFVVENKYEKMINLEETTKRYYPNGTLAAHTLGFTGTDNQGLTGIEAYYNSYLAGKDGKSVKAADAYGNALDSGIGSTYVAATNGLNVVTTLDWEIQSVVEEEIQSAYETHNPKGRVECIVMDVDNGEILASAIYPSFDLNNYNTLSEYYQTKYDLFEGTEEDRSAYKTKMLYEMWNNTIATQTYEPGSTFKIITSAIALEEGAISYETSSFSCRGACDVAGTTIHCHKVSGHGTQTFSQAIVNSCNPAFIQLGTAVGATTFKKYFEEFGYTQTSGSDIMGEASSIYYATTGAQFESLELAIYSFGQTFKVTPIQHIRAISAVANGGYLVVPHTVKSLVDDDGNVVKTFEYEADRQIISSETCSKILKALTNSTKNASVDGYNIVSKTGTSEKRDTVRDDDYISSCVSLAPAEDPQIAILVLVDDPTQGQHFGSAVAAPIVSNILKEVLPHLGIERNSEEEATLNVQNYVGKNAEKVREDLEEEHPDLKVVIKGEGDVVTEQLPKEGTVVSAEGVIILYTEGAVIEADAKVPDVMGKTPSVAIKKLIDANLNVSISGIFNDDYSNCTVISQSVESGQYVLPGTTIQLEFLYKEDIE